MAIDIGKRVPRALRVEISEIKDVLRKYRRCKRLSTIGYLKGCMVCQHFPGPSIGFEWDLGAKTKS